MAKNKKKRSKESFRANTPEAKARQVEGGIKGSEQSKNKRSIETEKEAEYDPFGRKYKYDIIKYLEEQINHGQYDSKFFPFSGRGFWRDNPYR